MTNDKKWEQVKVNQFVCKSSQMDLERHSHPETVRRSMADIDI